MVISIPSIQSLVGDHAGTIAGVGPGAGNAGVDWGEGDGWFWQLNGTYISRYGVLTGAEEVWLSMVDAEAQNEHVGVYTSGHPSPGFVALTGRGGTLYDGQMIINDAVDAEFLVGVSYPGSQFGQGGFTMNNSGAPPYTIWDRGIGNTVVGSLNRTQVSFVNPPFYSYYVDTVYWPNGYSKCQIASLNQSFNVFAAYSRPGVGDPQVIYLDRLVAPFGTPVTINHVGTYAAADIDPTWTQCDISGITMDRVDENPIMMITGNGAVKNYLMKVNWGTGDVLWKAEVPLNFSDVLEVEEFFQHCYIHNSRLGIFTNSPAKVTIYDTTDGSVVNTYTSDLAGISQIGRTGGQCYNDTLGCIALKMNFSETAGSPALLNDTPPVFDGWALLYVADGIAPPPPAGANNRFFMHAGKVSKDRA